MNYKYLLALTGVFIIALILRVYNLTNLPYGFHVDEVKAGWNAYSILKTGMDDRGNRLPLYYDSFGDFRPTGIIYSIIPSLMFFGKSIFAVRLTPALIGAITVVPIFLILNLLFANKLKTIGLAGSMLLALNPWHIIISRATSESVIAIFLALFGIYFILKTIRTNQWRFAVLCLLSFGFSYFFYHSIRVLAPLFVIIIVFLDRIYLKSAQNYTKPLLVILSLIALTGVFMSSKQSQGRLSQVSLISDFQVSYEIQKMPNEEDFGHVLTARIFHNRIASYIRRFTEEYISYFGTGFLIDDSLAKPIRYNVPYVGLISYIELVFLLLGISVLWQRKEVGLFAILLLLAPIPAAVTNEDSPNLQRAAFMIPFLIFIESYGVYLLFKAKGNVKIFLFILIAGYFLNFIYFWHMYTIHQKFSLATYYRDGGNVELIAELNKIKSDYKQIILSSHPDDLTPWVAFFSDKNPKELNGNIDSKMIDNIIFSGQRCPAILTFPENMKDILVVDAEGCELKESFKQKYKLKLVKTIKRPDESPPYYLWSNKLN